MKKVLILLFISFASVFEMAAQQTPDVIIPLWQKRYVPSAANVDSTFSSIVFKTERDSFAYADVMNFSDQSSTYGSTNIDSMLVVVQPIQDDSSITYVGVTLTSDDVTGYPGFGATMDVITVNPAVNSYFVTSDTFTVTVEFDVYSQSGASGCDSIKVVIYSGSLDASGAETSSTTFFIANDNAWHHKTATLEVTAPLSTPNQPILVLIEPKFTAETEGTNVANVSAKISN